jgi:dihydropteroate synthase
MSVVAPRPTFSIPLPGRAPLELGPRTLVMGILNITPDSFSDGGRALDPARALDLAVEMQEAGADIIDLGAESTRPGAAAVGVQEEWQRLSPVLKGLAARVHVPLSLDSYKADVARRALDEGVSIVNDVSGLRYDPGLGAVVAERDAALVLMHTRGHSREMYALADYADVVSEVTTELAWSVDRAVKAGVGRGKLIVDPGVGFAKRAEHSMAVLAAFDRFASLGCPLLAGPSRKSYLTLAIGSTTRAEDRDWATAAAVTAAVLGGAHIVRVHNVPAMVHVVRVADAIRGPL